MTAPATRTAAELATTIMRSLHGENLLRAPYGLLITVPYLTPLKRNLMSR